MPATTMRWRLFIFHLLLLSGVNFPGFPAGKTLNGSTSLQIRPVSAISMKSWSLSYWDGRRRTWRSLYRQKWSRYFEWKCQKSRSNTIGDFISMEFLQENFRFLLDTFLGGILEPYGPVFSSHSHSYLAIQLDTLISLSFYLTHEHSVSHDTVELGYSMCVEGITLSVFPVWLPKPTQRCTPVF